MKDWGSVIACANTPHSVPSLHTMQKAPSLLGCKVVYLFCCLLGLEVFSSVSGKIPADCNDLGSVDDVLPPPPKKKEKKKRYQHQI